MCFGSSKKKPVAAPLRPRQNQHKKKLILLGDMNVGKSSICEYYKHTCPVKNLPSTLGVSYFEFNIKSESGVEVHLDVWDTAGHEAYTNLLKMYYHDANIAFLVFDVGQKTSFDRVEFWASELSEYVDDKNMHLVLIGNKCDIKPSDRQITTAQADQYAKSKNIPYFETSALNGDGILELFQRTIETVASKQSR